MPTFLLIVHGLAAVALLGALTHQSAALFVRRTAGPQPFIGRYARVDDRLFVTAIVVLYVLVTLLGGVIYPTYRVDVRIPFEEMGLYWAVGLFELKEHAGGIGLAMLPLYAFVWRRQATTEHDRDRKLITAFLALVVWYDFLTGHVLNNIRGLA
jgi:hypothetical protein